MRSLIAVVLINMVCFNLYAQSGNVGIGIDPPQAKLHVDGDMKVEDVTTIADTNSNARFVFNPNAGVFEIMDESGNVLFSFNYNDTNNNAKGPKTSSSRMGLNSLEWTFNSPNESFEQIFDSDGNGTLTQGFFENPLDSEVFTEVSFEDVNETIRKTLESHPDFTRERFFNMNGNIQMEAMEYGDGKMFNFFDPTGTAQTKSVNIGNGDFNFTVCDTMDNKVAINPNEVKITDPDTNATCVGIGQVNIKVNDDQCIMDNLGLIQYDLNNFSTFFADKNGIIKFGSSSLEMAGFTFNPIEHKIEVQGSEDVTEDLNVSGNKNFRIDHPLDPTNKFLFHSCIEAPVPLNMYRGNVTTDKNGFAIVQMPVYFQALNIEYAYQLTVIGTFAQAIVDKEMRDNKFTIRTSEPNVKVSWQVTGQRNDRYLQDNPYETVREKTGRDKGRLLYDPNRVKPYSESLHKNWERHQERLRAESK
ncbi:MAG: hypothetical protein AAGA77_02050 [Bacteroidota bacterium]